MRLALLYLLTCSSVLATAQPAPPVTSESRDAALAYIGTANFVVGRVGRECLQTVGRTENPKDYVAHWQQRNQRYIAASAKYLSARMQEAQSSGGAAQRDAVQAELGKAVQSAAAQILHSWLEQGDKTLACQRALAIIDKGDYDFSPSTKMYAELEGLARWAQP